MACHINGNKSKPVPDAFGNRAYGNLISEKIPLTINTIIVFTNDRLGGVLDATASL